MRRRTVIAGAFVSGVLLVGCGAADTAPASEVAIDDPEAVEQPEAGDDLDDEVDDADEVDGARGEGQGEAPVEDASAPEPTDPETDGGPSVPADDTSGDTVMEPDAGRLADPCADHEGRESEVFIDLVAPVDEQVASGSVELVGCANVFEATVAWSLLDGDGRVLDEGFTTAACGTGCVGEFRDTVSLETAADEPVAYLQVFGPNVADEGPAQLELTEVIVVIG